MTTKEMIDELRKLGYEVQSRKRSDGGYIITKINGMTFTGAKGNTYARSVLGVELSSARAEQLSFNVQKYIKGTKKPKDKLSEELNKELRSVQRAWRKKGIKARITKKKLRWHLKQGGEKEAREYLQKMRRYGSGYAYEENVIYLAQYIRNVAKKVNDKELQEATYKTADYIESKKDVFREEWISDIYAYWYEVVSTHYDNNVVALAIQKTYSKF